MVERKRKKSYYVADLPCSGLEFLVQADDSQSQVSFEWQGVRMRMQVQIYDPSNALVKEDVMLG